MQAKQLFWLYKEIAKEHTCCEYTHSYLSKQSCKSRIEKLYKQSHISIMQMQNGSVTEKFECVH